ncbi:MAG: leucine-rich repeat domain-containing protein [Lachnospiraceae bacterium]|nr:leucine-rich repeat domain-containing protein [Lachnospiraceae bacterium]
MATTKKSIKTTGKKKGGKRYMKKAARRTLAALLMITALIVAAIPATPGAARAPSNPDSIRNDPTVLKYNSLDGSTRYYFKRITNVGINDAIIFHGFDTLDNDGNPTTPVNTDIAFDSIIHIVEMVQTGVSEDGVTPIYEEQGKDFVCLSVADELVNYDHILSFSCPTVEEVNKGFSGESTDNNVFQRFEGDNVKTIATGAFKNCKALQRVDAGNNDGVETSIGGEAFLNCENLETYTGRNTKIIGNKAFQNCKKMTNCYVNSDIKEIGNNAFEDSALENFPDFHVSDSIGEAAFKGTNLTSLKIYGPDGGETGVSLSNSIFKECKSLSNIDFIGNFTSLGTNTFDGCENLYHCGLADSMTSIGAHSFDGCKVLNNLVMPGKITGGNLPNDLLKDCKELAKLDLTNDQWQNTDLKINNIFDESWLRSDACNLEVWGYRWYNPETGDPTKSLAYQYCIKKKVPYKCKDDEGGWADKYFDVDKDGNLLYVDVDAYKADTSTPEHIEVPEAVHGTSILHITSGAFRDINNNINSIDVKPTKISVESGAFNHAGLDYVRFAEGADTEIENVAGVFPNGNFYIYGDILNDSKDSLNALEYATRYNVEFRGNGRYDDESDYITLVVKPEDSKATLVGILKKDAPAAGSEYDTYQTTHSALASETANVWLPGGISAIKDDFFQTDTYLRKVKADGLTEVKTDQFYNSGPIEDIVLNGNWEPGSFGARPFRNATVKKISILPEGGLYSVDKYGVIYGDSGATIIEGIENSIDANGSNTRYEVPGSVTKIEDSAFEDNKWMNLFSTVYDNNNDYKSNIRIIPKNAFYNASELSRVVIGQYDGSMPGRVQEGAFDYSVSSIASNDMRLDVYDSRIIYDRAFADSSRKYNFYSNEGDTTYLLCEDENDNVKNLIWHKVEDTSKKSLDDYEIYFPKNNGKYPYRTEPYTFVCGMNDDTDSPDCSDIIVRDKTTKSFLDPKYFEVKSNLVDIAASKTSDTTVPVTLFGVAENGYSGQLYRDIVIYSEGGGGGITPSGRFDVTWKYNGPTRSGATVYNPDNDFQYWNEGVPAVEKLFDTKYKKEVVPQGSSSISSNQYYIEKYGVVSPGLGDNTGYGYFHIMDAGGEEHWEEIPYNIRKDIGTNTAPDGSKSIIIGTKESGISGNSIYAKFILKDKGVTLNEGEEYEVGMIERISDKKGRARLFGLSPKYTGTYVYEFPIPVDPSSSSSSHGGSSTTTSSSSGGGTSSSSSSSGSSSSSSSKSSSSKSSSKGGSSSSSRSSSGSSSSSGSGNKNSGTTIVNRNYYGKNGGTADELEEMLRAAHIDSINGGTADGYQVNITKSDAAEASFREALLRRYGSLDNIRYFSMDIDVKDENGNDIDTTGMTVTLTLPLPSSMEQYGTNNQVATVDSAGDLEDLNVQFSTLEGRPCATFVCPHFSPYGFYVNTSDLAIGTLDNTPKTGDPIPLKWFVSFGLAAFSIFLFLKKDPKPQANPA